MSTIRVGKRKKFTTVARETVNDGRLSFRARGVLVWLLDKPDDWKTTADAISASGTEGRNAVRSALTELEVCGYLERRRWRSGNGAWQSEWIVHEVPIRPKLISGAHQPQRKTGPQLLRLKPNTDLAEHDSLSVDNRPPTKFVSYCKQCERIEFDCYCTTPQLEER